MNLAARNLLWDKTRLALSVAGVALAVMLILILTGFVSGINLQLSRYLDHAPGSVVLVQSGSQGNSSVLPMETVDMMFFMMRGMQGNQREVDSSSAPTSPTNQLGMKQGDTPEGYLK